MREAMGYDALQIESPAVYHIGCSLMRIGVDQRAEDRELLVEDIIKQQWVSGLRLRNAEEKHLSAPSCSLEGLCCRYRVAHALYNAIASLMAECIPDSFLYIDLHRVDRIICSDLEPYFPSLGNRLAQKYP